MSRLSSISDPDLLFVLPAHQPKCPLLTRFLPPSSLFILREIGGEGHRMPVKNTQPMWTPLPNQENYPSGCPQGWILSAILPFPLSSPFHSPLFESLTCSPQ